MGEALAPATDLDGDGVLDAILGAPFGAAEFGAVYVVPGTAP